MGPPPPASRNDASKILAVGDNFRQRESLQELFAPTEIELVLARDGGSGLKAFYAERPDLVVLDLELRDLDGLDVLARIRELSEAPTIVIAAAEADGDERAKVLRAGADDCVSRPFDGPEMLARIEALLRRSRPSDEEPDVLDDEFIHIDRARHRAEVLGVEVALTPTEFRMLSTFAQHPGRVLGHGQLLEMVWGNGVRERDEVKLYVSYLRRKLGAAAKVNPVETVRGVGYRYKPQRIP